MFEYARYCKYLISLFLIVNFAVTSALPRSSAHRFHDSNSIDAINDDDDDSPYPDYHEDPTTENPTELPTYGPSSTISTPSTNGPDSIPSSTTDSIVSIDTTTVSIPTTETPSTTKNPDDQPPKPPTEASPIDGSSIMYPMNITDWMITLLKRFGNLISDEHLRESRENEYITYLIQSEIFTMACNGNHHFILPPNVDEKAEKRFRKNAKAFGLMWLDLLYTENLDAILNDAVRKTIFLDQSNQMKSSRYEEVMERMQKYLPKILNKIVDSIDEDESLADKFLKYRREVSVHKGLVIYFSSDDLRQDWVDKSNLAEWLNNMDIRRFLIHKQFLKIVQNYPTIYALFKTMKQVKEDYPEDIYAGLNASYTKILNNSAINFVVDEYPKKTIEKFLNELIESMNASDAAKWMYKNALKNSSYVEESFPRFEIF